MRPTRQGFRILISNPYLSIGAKEFDTHCRPNADARWGPADAVWRDSEALVLVDGALWPLPCCPPSDSSTVCCLHGRTSREDRRFVIFLERIISMALLKLMLTFFCPENFQLTYLVSNLTFDSLSGLSVNLTLITVLDGRRKVDFTPRRKTSFFIVQNSVFDILQFKLCAVHLSIKIFNFGEVATVPTLTVFHRHMLLFTHVRCYPSAPVAFFQTSMSGKNVCVCCAIMMCSKIMCNKWK
jgi:hypothetical protein